MSYQSNILSGIEKILIYLLLFVVVACSNANVFIQTDGTKSPPMSQFIQALQEKDTHRFLLFFSTSTPFSHVSTITNPPVSIKVQFQELKADLEDQKGLYEALFDADGDDCFRDWAEGTDETDWVETKSGRFVRLQVEGKDMVYVEWRKEGKHWVIVTIAEPAA